MLSDYLAELKKIELLEPDEERRLWREYKENADQDCRRQLIEHYQPLVFKTAMRWQADEATMLDLIQEGTVGLIEAVENYDHTLGVAFSLFAMHRIRGRIADYAAREGKRNLVYIDDQEGEAAAAEAVYQLTDASVDIPAQAEHNYLMEQVRRAVGRLPKKEQIVLNAVYLAEQEPKQLAAAMDMSLSHVYRLQKQGLRRVRGMLSKLMQELKK